MLVWLTRLSKIGCELYCNIQKSSHFNVAIIPKIHEPKVSILMQDGNQTYEWPVYKAVS